MVKVYEINRRPVGHGSIQSSVRTCPPAIRASLEEKKREIEKRMDACFWAYTMFGEKELLPLMSKGRELILRIDFILGIPHHEEGYNRKRLRRNKR